MDKEFLEEYEKKEEEEYQKYVQRVFSNGLEISGKYPDLSRFPKIQEPIIILEVEQDKPYQGDLWSQIPFAGSIMISLKPVSKDNCSVVNGFDPDDISELIKLAKETGKVQFGLGGIAIFFQNLDYLDPIFQELRPPILRPMPLRYFLDEKTEKKWMDEFFTIAKISYVDYVREICGSNWESEHTVMHSLLDKAEIFLTMKMMNLNDECDKLSNYLIDDPFFADDYMVKMCYLTVPKINPLTSNVNVNISKLFNADSNEKYKERKITVPEIGKLLMKKIVVHPTTYYGCITVMEHYAQNDLYKILRSMSDAIVSNDIDKIFHDSANLELSFDNAWKDAIKIKSDSEKIRTGISIATGIVGGIVTNSTTGIPGLLAGLGFNYIDKRLDASNSSISEKIAKIRKKDYLINIYDFSKKYSLS